MGAIVTYTTRFFFTHGDVLFYNERAYNILQGDFSALINYTKGPIYPLFLAAGHAIFQPDPVHEIPVLKWVNFFIFVLSMAFADILVTYLDRDMEPERLKGKSPIPSPLFRSFGYALFLATSLCLIRISLNTPDLLVLGVICLCVALVLRIRREPLRYSRHIVLGASLGLGYLLRTSLLVLSPVFFIIAGLTHKSISRISPRVLSSITVMILIAAPMIIALSVKENRFTFGDVGAVNYAMCVSGVEGESRSKIIWEEPRIYLYNWEDKCTRALAYDVGYWWGHRHKPVFDFRAQVESFFKNLLIVLNMVDWVWVLLGLTIVQWFTGGFSFGTLRPISSFWLLLAIGLAGISLYCLVMVQVRLVAPFIFLCLLSLPLSVRYIKGGSLKSKLTSSMTIVSIITLLVIIISCSITQSLRGLTDSGSKQSYKQRYEELVRVSNFLQSKGLRKGDKVSAFYLAPGYWARMGGLKIVAEISDEDKFLELSEEKREEAVEILADNGIQAVVVRNPKFKELTSEGWEHAPGTEDYFVLRINRGS